MPPRFRMHRRKVKEEADEGFQYLGKIKRFSTTSATSCTVV